MQLSGFDPVIANLENAINRFNFNKISVKRSSYAVIPCVDIPFFHDTKEGAVDAAAKLGVDVMWRAPKSSNPAEQAELIEEVIGAGVSGIGIGPIDGDEVREALQKADRSGIKIVCFDTDISGVNKSGFIGTDNYKAGKMLGELVIKKLNGRGKILGTMSNKNKNMKDRIEGFMEGIKKSSDIKVLSFEATEQSKAEDRWQSLKINTKTPVLTALFVWMQWEASAENKEDLGITGFWSTKQKTQEILKKATCLYWRNVKTLGELAVRRLHEACSGKQFPIMRMSTMKLTK